MVVSLSTEGNSPLPPRPVAKLGVMTEKEDYSSIFFEAALAITDIPPIPIPLVFLRCTIAMRCCRPSKRRGERHVGCLAPALAIAELTPPSKPLTSTQSRRFLGGCPVASVKLARTLADATIQLPTSDSLLSPRDAETECSREGRLYPLPRAGAAAGCTAIAAPHHSLSREIILVSWSPASPHASPELFLCKRTRIAACCTYPWTLGVVRYSWRHGGTRARARG